MGKRKKKAKRRKQRHEEQQFLTFDTPEGGIGGINVEFAKLLSRLEPEDRERRWINRWTTEDDLKCEPWFTMDEHGNTREAHDSALAVLARAGKAAGEVWLWCLHCERFFQAKDLKLDFLGNWQRCPFDDCRAAGLDVDILVWDAYKDDDPRWPESQDALYFGLQLRRGPDSSN